MFGSTPLAAVLGAAPAPSTDPADLRPFVRQACAAGIALLLIKPGTKLPIDPRTPAQRDADDKAARDAAHDAGNPRFHAVKSPSGLHLATTDAKTVTRYLDRVVPMYADPINFALEVGRSRLILVDVDTEAERAAFLSWWSNAEGRDMRSVAPTVTSPGAVDPATGQWVHRGGGHYYFTIPDGVTLPPETGNYTHRTEAGQFSVAWADRYVLIPPSVRPEGPYVFSGMDMPAPAALLELINGRAEQWRANRDRVAQRQTDDGGQFDSAIDEWSESVSWSDILEPHGWTPTVDTDRCGCPVWTAPGMHNSPKSATAHTSGCDLGRYTVTNAPLHVWTDHTDAQLDAWLLDRGTKTVTKLQLVAVYEHGGDLAAACRALGLSEVAESNGTHLTDEQLQISPTAMAATLAVEWTLPTVAPMVPPADTAGPPPDPEPTDIAALFGRPTDEDSAPGAGDASHTDWSADAWRRWY